MGLKLAGKALNAVTWIATLLPIRGEIGHRLSGLVAKPLSPCCATWRAEQRGDLTDFDSEAPAAAAAAAALMSAIGVRKGHARPLRG